MRRLLISSAVSLLGLALFFSSLWGAADFIALKPRTLLSILEAQGGSSERDILSALEDMRLAAALNPYDPDLAFDIGALHEWRALRHPAWSRAAMESRFSAIGYYQRAAGLRPSWSSAWAHLAYSKAMNQQLDGAAATALENAMVFGPWKPLIHYKVCWVGLAAWDQLTLRQREALQSHISRSFANEDHGRSIIKAALELGREDVILPLLEADWAKTYYESLLKKRESR